jgi:hypothetical protein
MVVASCPYIEYFHIKKEPLILILINTLYFYKKTNSFFHENISCILAPCNRFNKFLR